MNLDGIDVFVKVIQAGSFTKAAKQLARPITTVSDKVAQLEKRLGVTLIHRTTRQLKLTTVGENYFHKCEKALVEFERAEYDLQSTKSEPQGRLRITMPVDVGHTLVPSIVKKFTKEFPKVKLELIVTNRRVDLLSESIDLAIRVGNLADSTLRVRKFIETAASMWATPELIKKYGQPQTVKQLEKFPYVRFVIDHPQFIEMSRGKEKVKLKLVSQIMADDLETVKKLVLNSEGIGLIPNYICEKEENEGSLIRLLPDWTRGKIILSFVYPAQKFVSSNIKAFIDLALQEQF